MKAMKTPTPISMTIVTRLGGSGIPSLVNVSVTVQVASPMRNENNIITTVKNFLGPIFYSHTNFLIYPKN